MQANAQQNAYNDEPEFNMISVHIYQHVAMDLEAVVDPKTLNLSGQQMPELKQFLADGKDIKDLIANGLFTYRYDAVWRVPNPKYNQQMMMKAGKNVNGMPIDNRLYGKDTKQQAASPFPPQQGYDQKRMVVPETVGELTGTLGQRPNFINDGRQRMPNNPQGGMNGPMGNPLAMEGNRNQNPMMPQNNMLQGMPPPQMNQQMMSQGMAPQTMYQPNVPQRPSSRGMPSPNNPLTGPNNQRMPQNMFNPNMPPQNMAMQAMPQQPPMHPQMNQMNQPQNMMHQNMSMEQIMAQSRNGQNMIPGIPPGNNMSNIKSPGPQSSPLSNINSEHTVPNLPVNQNNLAPNTVSPPVPESFEPSNQGNVATPAAQEPKQEGVNPTESTTDTISQSMSNPESTTNELKEPSPSPIQNNQEGAQNELQSLRPAGVDDSIDIEKKIPETVDEMEHERKYIEPVKPITPESSLESGAAAPPTTVTALIYKHLAFNQMITVIPETNQVVGEISESLRNLLAVKSVNDLINEHALIKVGKKKVPAPGDNKASEMIPRTDDNNNEKEKLESDSMENPDKRPRLA